MKGFFTKLLFIVLVASLSLNTFYYLKNVRLTTNLFEQYSQQLQNSSEALRLSVKSEDIITKQQHYLDAHRALARARTISEIIGLQNNRYKYDLNGQTYFTIPYEMHWILEFAAYSENSEDDLKAVAEIFEVYIKHILPKSIKDVEQIKKALYEIHSEIDTNNMLPSDISLPSTFYRY